MFSLFFFVLTVPQVEALHKYKVARTIIAFTYLCLGISNLVEVLFHDDAIDIPMTCMITLFVSMFQAMLLTYTHLTLINLDFATKKKLITESLPFLICIIIGIVSLSLDTKREYTNKLNFIFVVYYISLLFRYTIYFRNVYNGYKKRMDNYFAEQEIKRFSWIYYSFYASLTVGIVALTSICFDSVLGKIAFNLIVLLFYSYFGVHFLNYAYQFRMHEAVIREDPNLSDQKEQKHNYSHLEARIKKWCSEKGFVKQGLTIEDLATRLNSNRTYLSLYVNKHLNTTFKGWITDLRINEAKDILLKQSDVSISDVAEQVGFSDRSNFNKQFVKQTGLTPKAWRELEWN